MNVYRACLRDTAVNAVATAVTERSKGVDILIRSRCQCCLRFTVRKPKWSGVLTHLRKEGERGRKGTSEVRGAPGCVGADKRGRRLPRRAAQEVKSNRRRQTCLGAVFLSHPPGTESCPHNFMSSRRLGERSQRSPLDGYGCVVRLRYGVGEPVDTWGFRYQGSL